VGKIKSRVNTAARLHLEGVDEGDEVSGSGSAELTGGWRARNELSFRIGDDAVLNAKCEVSSSRAC
jgi:hypothetical protein